MKQALTADQRQTVLKTLRNFGGDMAATGRALDISPRTVANVKNSYDADSPIMDSRYARDAGKRGERRNAFDTCAGDIMQGHLLDDEDELYDED